MTYRELRCKEVVNYCDGRKLGYVADLEICPASGQICNLIVPELGKTIGCLCGGKKSVIPYCDIIKIGPDVIVVRAPEKNCRKK